MGIKMDLAKTCKKFSIRYLVVHLTKIINLQGQYAALRPPPLVHITFSLVYIHLAINSTFELTLKVIKCVKNMGSSNILN